MSSTDILSMVSIYQKKLDKYSRQSPIETDKVLTYLHKLKHLSVTVKHLEVTGVGKSVNGLRHQPGLIGEKARAIVLKWRKMVTEEEEQDKEMMEIENAKRSSMSYEVENSISPHQEYVPTRIEAHEIRAESDECEVSDDGDRLEIEMREVEPEVLPQPREVPTYSHKLSDRVTDDESNCNGYNPLTSREDFASIKPPPLDKKVYKPCNMEDLDNSINELDDSLPINGIKNSTDMYSPSVKKHKKHKEKKSHKHRDRSSSSKHEEKVRDKMHKSSPREKSKDQVLEDSDRKKDRSSNSSKDNENHCDQYIIKSDFLTPPRLDESMESNHTEESLPSSSKKSKKHREKSHRKEHKSKDENRDKKLSSGSSKEKSKSENKMEKHEMHEKHSSRSEKHSSKSDKHSDGKSSHNSKRHISDEVVSPKRQKASKHSHENPNTGFDDALMCVESPSKKKKKSRSRDKEKRKSDSSSRSDAALKPKRMSPHGSPEVILPQLPSHMEIDEEMHTPQLMTSYKPLPHVSHRHDAANSMTDEEALSLMFSSKSSKQRSGIYAGKSVGRSKVPTLYNSCITVLQENIDAIETTGFIPYEILRPILEKASPQQLFNLEDLNPYLLEDTDKLWAAHCKKTFRNKTLLDMETYRDMFTRCTDENQARMQAVTKNLQMKYVQKPCPKRMTQLVFVDSAAKAPKSVQRAQARYGTGAGSHSNPRPTRGEETLANKSSVVSNPGTSSTPSVAPPPPPSQSQRPDRPFPQRTAVKKHKIAPLMAKSLQLHKQVCRR